MKELLSKLENKEPKEVIIPLIINLDEITDDVVKVLFDRYLLSSDFIEVFNLLLIKNINLNVILDYNRTLLFYVVDNFIYIDNIYKENAKYALSHLLDIIDEEHRDDFGLTYLDWFISINPMFDDFFIYLLNYPKHKKYFYTDYKIFPKKYIDYYDQETLDYISDCTIDRLLQRRCHYFHCLNSNNEYDKENRDEYKSSKLILEEAINIMLSKLEDKKEEIIKKSIFHETQNSLLIYYLHEIGYNINQKYFDEFFIYEIQKLIKNYEKYNGDYNLYKEKHLFPPFSDIAPMIRCLKKIKYYEMPSFIYEPYQFSEFIEKQIKDFPIFNNYFIVDGNYPDNEYCKNNYELAYKESLKLINSL